MSWRQSPSGGSVGFIWPNERFILLMPEPRADGLIRVKVFPHNADIPVGHTDNEVWIDWNKIGSFANIMVGCERPR